MCKHLQEQVYKSFYWEGWRQGAAHWIVVSLKLRGLPPQPSSRQHFAKLAHLHKDSAQQGSATVGVSVSLQSRDNLLELGVFEVGTPT